MKQYSEVLFEEVKNWEFELRFTSSISSSPDCPIDYNHLFSILNWCYRAAESSSPSGYSDSKLYLIPLNYINRIIKEKDFAIFEIPHPDLPFLVGLLLSSINNYEQNILPPVPFHFDFYKCAKVTFGDQTKFKLLIQVISLKENYLRSISIEVIKLNPKILTISSISHLSDLFQSSHTASQKEINPKSLWQLRGLVLLEEFLMNSRYWLKKQALWTTFNETISNVVINFEQISAKNAK
jgi:hypothetical protein